MRAQRAHAPDVRAAQGRRGRRAGRRILGRVPAPRVPSHHPAPWLRFRRPREDHRAHADPCRRPRRLLHARGRDRRLPAARRRRTRRPTRHRPRHHVRQGRADPRLLRHARRGELTGMTTIRVATDCTLAPPRVLHAPYDFGPRRTQVWPAVHAEPLTVHALGETTAEATEGTPAGIGINWERCRYDWSEPGRVTATVTDSNVYAHPGSSWQLTAAPAARGSRVEMVWQRTFRRNPRGL